MSKRRLAIGVVALAAILLGGRALSVLYDSYAWYDSLGARLIWTERAMDTALVLAAGFIVATAFVLANLAFTSSSIVGLTRPRRLANVEFGEAVPRTQLRVAAVTISVAVAVTLMRLLPQWTSVALARLGVDFRESDPYLHHDLSFYVTWLPRERSIYSWTFALLVTTAAIVLAVYLFSAAVRLVGGQLRVTEPARRHLGILAALLLLLAAWSYRIDSFGLLVSSGPGAAGFSQFRHEWMLPALLALSLATAALALTVAVTAWMGQLRTSLVAIMVAIGLAATVKEILPFVVLRSTPPAEQVRDDAPYVATRADFARRAFGAEAESDDGGIPTYESLIAVAGAPSRRDTLVGPGAAGALVVDDPTLDIAAPSLGTGLARLAHAWAARDFGLMSDSIRRRSRIVTVRDVRERISRLYPLFTVGPTMNALFRSDTLYWSAALYSSSDSYPLAEQRKIWGENRSYLHRVGTALVNARTGRAYAAIDVPPEPVAAGWLRRFGSRRSQADARSLQHALSISTGSLQAGPAATDSSFRGEVTRLYGRMRAALSAGDLRAFGLSYDSLGALVREGKK